MKTMILAAGYGTRLRPVTHTLPKPLVPLANLPLIAWAVESFLRADVYDFIVNLHHLPDAIEAYLTDRYVEEATFNFSFEREILGTGGGVRKVRPLLENEKEFFLVNGDTVQIHPVQELRKARHSLDAIAALTLRHPPEGDRFTEVFFENGQITGFGKGTGEPLMFSGTHLISPRIFQYLPDMDFSGIVDATYQPLLDAKKEKIAGVVDQGGLWFDIGTPQRYMSASRTLLDMTMKRQVAPALGSRIIGDSLIDQSASISGRPSRSTVGARSVIEGELRDSVVWDDCRIGPGVALQSCVVAHGVEIATPRTLKNMLICRDDTVIPRDEGYLFEDGLVFKKI